MSLLKDHAADTIFALSGNGVLAFFDAALDVGINIIDTRHESAAVQAAAGLALSTRRPQVCIVTEGPGLCNALGAIAALHHDGVPVIVITNCEPAAEENIGAFQAVPLIEMTAPITKWAGKVQDIHQLPDVIARGFREAGTGIPGPVVIALPNDILHGYVDDSEIVRRSPATSRQTDAPQPSAEFIRRTLELLNNAKKPLILAGAAAFWDQADTALVEFVERTNIPVGTCGLARGLVPDTHRCAIGDGTPREAPPSLPEADVVLVLGERMDHMLSFGKAWSPNVSIIHVFPDETELGRSLDTRLSTSATCSNVVAGLLANLEEHRWPESTWLATLKSQQSARQAEIAAVAEEGENGLHPGYVAQVVKAVIPRASIQVFDGANANLWAREYFPAEAAEHYLHMGRLSMIGFGLPNALGAKAAQPDRAVVLMVGDGSLGFHFMEFETAVRHRLPIIVVVFNNAGWGIEQHFQTQLFDRLTCTGLLPVRYDRMAEAVGGLGLYVDQTCELKPALERALAAGKPAVINVVTENVPHRVTLLAAKKLNVQLNAQRPA